jgi:FOG: WD40 repeat
VINFDQAQAGITGLVFLKGGDQLAGTSLDGNLYWWQVGYDEKKREYSGSVFRTSGAHGEGALALAISADGQRLITGGADHKVIVWKADDGSQIKVFSDAAQPIYAVALSPDGKIAAGAGREGVVYLWDVEGGKLLYTTVPGSPAQAPPPPAAPAAPTKDGKP